MAVSPQRTAQIARYERVLNNALSRVIGRQPLPEAVASFNGVPDLVRVADPLSTATVDAVHKGARSQPAQDAFGWQAARVFGMQDLVAVSVLQPGRSGGVLTERVPGGVPSTWEALQGALILKHVNVGAADPSAAAQSDMQRIVGMSWLLHEPDRHLAQFGISAEGILGFDHGHIGAWYVRNRSPLVVPLHDALLGLAGLRGPRALEVRAQLKPEVVDSLTANASGADLERAHAQTLGSWRGPLLGQKLWKTTRFTQSREYVDGVQARLEHLKNTGEIAYVDPLLSR